MSSLAQWQQRFVAAMHSPGEADADLGQRSGLDVYRNNIRHSLIEALGVAYPHTRTLLGERYFDALASQHVAQCLPSDPRLQRYGAGFSERIDAMPGLAEYRYVADICRLERARLDISHAADAEALEANRLGLAQDPEALSIRPHPASRCVACDHDVGELWSSLEQPSGETPRLGDAGPGHWLLVRRRSRVSVTRIDSACAALYQTLTGDLALGDALDKVMGDPAAAGGNIGQALGTLLGLGALIDATPPSTAPTPDACPSETRT
ncbi:HvfC/BufC family peptide modification chaperone [Halomonas sp. V046]|uniref:HvfC/BufC family peptide modification chaperone n=1 Tax=Halomonas sp. V046 TaxID=3459611 RepID=UPI004044EDB8